MDILRKWSSCDRTNVFLCHSHHRQSATELLGIDGIIIVEVVAADFAFLNVEIEEARGINAAADFGKR